MMVRVLHQHGGSPQKRHSSSTDRVRLVDGCGRVVEGALAPAVLEASSQPEHAASMTNTLKAARDRALFIGVFFE
jgi:hypothetical protein